VWKTMDEQLSIFGQVITTVIQKWKTRNSYPFLDNCRASTWLPRTQAILFFCVSRISSGLLRAYRAKTTVRSILPRFAGSPCGVAAD
jgi:hypothetical protein